MNQSLLRPRVGEQDLSTGFGTCFIYLFYLLVCLGFCSDNAILDIASFYYQGGGI